MAGPCWTLARGKETGVPVRLRLALQNLTLASHVTELMLVRHQSHAKAAAACHAAPDHEPVAWLKNVQRHLLACITILEPSSVNPRPETEAFWSPQHELSGCITDALEDSTHTNHSYA